MKLADLGRQVALAKRHTDLAKKDLDEGNKRKKSEDDNLKKAQEADKKATEEVAKKVEAAKKPVADKEAADKYIKRAFDIIDKTEKKQLMPRISSDRNNFECRYCSWQTRCWSMDD